jgi:acyl-CoA synthetase (AMP-forming)/AMP-acid ligase II
VDIAIVDSLGQPLQAGEVGEIRINSPSNMSGYWNLPKETSAALDSDGWLNTGDAGYLDDEGYLFVNGRIKEMIVTGGENVYPGEVENALFGHPAVKEVAVIGIPSARWGQEVRAVVVLNEGYARDDESLLAFARRHIGGYKLPKSFSFLPELPRNAAGKVLKGQLREQLT